MDKHLATLTDKIMGVNRDLAGLKIEKQKLRDAINQLKNPAVLAELNAFDQKKTELHTKIVQFEAEIRNIDVQVKDILKRDEDNTGRIIKEQEREESIFEKENERLTSQARHFEKELSIQEEKQTKFYAASKQLYDRRNVLQETINKSEGEVYKLEEDARQVEFHINAIGLENAKVKAELSSFEAEFEQYRNVELDGQVKDDLKR